MKANNKHISLETAKLLKDCGIESELQFILFNNNTVQIFNSKYENGDWIQNDSISAYTWQEILWENPKEFFGDEEKVVWVETCTFANHLVSEKYTPGKSAYILDLLQEKKYNEADQYFRENCILIKK